MKEKAKFYETTITLKILSDRPLDECELNDILQDSDSGDLVLTIKKKSGKSISPKKMANQLYEYGSEPGFMQLDDNGHPID